MTASDVDILIIGAGPAGMAAAVTVAQAPVKLSTLLLDEQPTAGGQIFRALAQAPERLQTLLGTDYQYGHSLLKRLDSSPIDHRPNATVWRIDDDGTVTWSEQGKSQQVKAKRIIIATGATERAIPIPGWTLPGVMTAGAAQIMLKSSSIVPDGAVLAGSGPLLYLLATQLIAAGSAPLALVETQTNSQAIQASLRNVAGLIRGRSALKKGLRMLRVIKRHGTPRYIGAKNLRIEGNDTQAQALRFQHRGKELTLTGDHFLLHQGVVPNTQISRSLQLRHHWNQSQHCFAPDTNPYGLSSNPLFYIAGDGSGIYGARAAEYQGSISAQHALHAIGLIDEQTLHTNTASARQHLAAETAIRPFLDALYQPPEQIRNPADSTIICRCEEVTAGVIRAQAKLGCHGPNQTKAFTRCGMGPCQGRYCGLTVTDILARENNLTHHEVGAYRIRPPIKPVTIAELASLHASAD